MKECECGKTNQSSDGSEPLPKDQAANLTTHRHEKGERREQTRMKEVHDV